jgi:hypothetical protein
MSLRSSDTVWSGRAHNYVVLVGLGALALYMWVWADVGPAGLVVGTLALLVAVFFCWIRVEVTETQIEIAFGPFQWPKKTIVVSEVEEATTEHVQPLRYGGWGYRLCGAGCRAIVIRRGEALRLEMNDGKVLLITVDHADEAAALINDLRARTAE